MSYEEINMSTPLQGELSLESELPLGVDTLGDQLNPSSYSSPLPDTNLPKGDAGFMDIFKKKWFWAVLLVIVLVSLYFFYNKKKNNNEDKSEKVV